MLNKRNNRKSKYKGSGYLLTISIQLSETLHKEELSTDSSVTYYSFLCITNEKTSS